MEHPTGMIAEPPTGVDAEDGATHTDSSGSWKYDKASTTWKGQNGAKDLGNTIELDNVNVKGYKSNYVPSGAYGPDKDLTHAAMVAAAVALAVTGGLVAGGSYVVAEGVAAFSQITWSSAVVGMASNVVSQGIAYSGDFTKINMIEMLSSAVPGLGSATVGASFNFNFAEYDKGIQTPKSFDHAFLQIGGAILANRFGKKIDSSPIFSKGVGSTYGTVAKISATAVADTTPMLANEVQKP